MATFAIGGMIVSILATLFTIPSHIPDIFGFASILFLLTAFIVGALLRRSKIQTTSLSENVEIKNIVKKWPFLRLAFAYFVMSYIGLMTVSHGAALLQERGISVALMSLTPFALNFGYIFGALLGGIIITRYPTHIIPLAFIVISMVSLFATNTTVSASIWFLAIFCIGLMFGSTVSIFVVLLSRCFGKEHAGDLFGRINIGYGLAGFIAPIFTAHLYELNGSYSLPLWMTIILGGLGLFALSGQTNTNQ